MTTERQVKLNALRTAMKTLTLEQRQDMAKRGIIQTIEGRTLSPYNTCLVYLQSNGNTPTVIGGYQQWRKAKRQVKKGEHGYTIFFPVGKKDESTGDIKAAELFFTATVFDISQTEPATANTPPAPEPALTPRLTPTPDKTNTNNIMEGWQAV